MTQFDPAVIYAMYGFDPTRAITGPEYSTRMPSYGDLSTISSGEFGRQMDQQLLALRQSQAAIRQIQAQMAAQTSGGGSTDSSSGSSSSQGADTKGTNNQVSGIGEEGAPGRAVPRSLGGSIPDFSAVQPAVIPATPPMGSNNLQRQFGAVPYQQDNLMAPYFEMGREIANRTGTNMGNRLNNVRYNSSWAKDLYSPVVDMFKSSVSRKQGVYGG